MYTRSSERTAGSCRHGGSNILKLGDVQPFGFQSSTYEVPSRLYSPQRQQHD